MGKRNTIVISSDDDGDKMCSLSSKSKLYTPNLKREANSSSAPQENPNRAKRPRISNTCSPSPTDHDGFEEMNLFFEDFNEGFYGFKVPAGSQRISKETWVDKYKPRSLEDLAVHKKKVEEVNLWFEERLRNAEVILSL
jgi:cell cycle checkpoint protein